MLAMTPGMAVLLRFSSATVIVITFLGFVVSCDTPDTITFDRSAAPLNAGLAGTATTLGEGGVGDVSTADGDGVAVVLVDDGVGEASAEGDGLTALAPRHSWLKMISVIIIVSADLFIMVLPFSRYIIIFSLYFSLLRLTCGCVNITHILNCYGGMNLQSMRLKPFIYLFVAAALLIYIGIGLYNKLQTTNYTIRSSKVPGAFNGFVIANLSDIHSELFGDDQSTLINLVSAGKPNAILLSGDVVDRETQNFSNVIVLMQELCKIAPVYAVYGNNEQSDKSLIDNVATLYKNCGVTLLDNASQTISIDDQKIELFGLTMANNVPVGNSLSTYLLRNLRAPDPGVFSILLYHPSNYFDFVEPYGYDLVLSGHLHGGLIRLPLVGGVFSPEEATGALFPRYSGGLYHKGTTTLIANRGLTSSHGIPRFYNRPEVVFVTLKNN